MADAVRIANSEDHIDASCDASRDICNHAVPDPVVRDGDDFVADRGNGC